MRLVTYTVNIGNIIIQLNPEDYFLQRKGATTYTSSNPYKKRTELLFNYSNLLAVEHIQPQLIHYIFNS